MPRPIGTKDSALGLSEIIDSAKSTIVLVSPFVQLSPTHKLKLKEASEAGKQILLVCRKEQLHANQLAELGGIRNLRMIDHANVHAKCYFNESKMLITSLNLYNSSIDNNVELGVWFDGSESKEKFSKAVADAISEMNIGELNLELAKVFTKSGAPRNFERKKFETQFRLHAFKPLPNIKGYCIRCCERVSYMNGSYPLCTKCFVDWATEYDFDAPERCCHWCGETNATSKRKPLCYSCFSKYREAVKDYGGKNETENDPVAQAAMSDDQPQPVVQSAKPRKEDSSPGGMNYKMIAVTAIAFLVLLTGGYFLNEYLNNPPVEPKKEDVLIQIVRDYYASWKKSPDSLAAYFASGVENFMAIKNTTPSVIVGKVKQDAKEYMYPQTRIIDSTFSVSTDAFGNNVVSFWANCECFRKSKVQFQTCTVHEEFVFDANNKIIAINELAVEKLEFSFKDPK